MTTNVAHDERGGPTRVGNLADRGNPYIQRGNRLVRGEENVAGFENAYQRMTRWDEGWAEIEMDAGPEHHNPMGTVHGGYVASLADTAMGMAVISTLEDDESFTTLDMHTSFLRAFWSGRLTARAEVVRRGARIRRVDAIVRDDAGKEIARATSTCMVLTDHLEEGRRTSR